MRNTCAFVTCLLVACSGGGVRPEGELFPEDSLQRLPPQYALGVQLLLVDSAGIRAELVAGTALARPEQGQTWFLGAVRARFYRGGHLVGELTADSARIDERTETMAAFGRVVARSHPEGRRLETTALFWDQRRREFFSPAPVRLVTPTEVIEGTGFQASQDLQQYRVENVRGRRQ